MLSKASPLYVSVIPTMAKTTFPAIARDGLLHFGVITGAEPTDWNAVVVNAKYIKRNLRSKEKSPPCAPKNEIKTHVLFRVRSVSKLFVMMQKKIKV
jgi:hypothetical protein